MRLKVRSIANRGEYPKERIVMRAIVDVDVGDFAVFRAIHLGDGRVSSQVVDVFWFPDKRIEKNDLVALYTKKGTASDRIMKSGRTIHFYYWGKDTALWAESDYAPILVYASNWEVFSEPSPAK